MNSLSKTLAHFPTKKIVLPAGKLVLREAEKKDLKVLNAIVQEPGVNEFLLLPLPVSMKSTLDHWKEIRQLGKWVVAELDGEIVGSMELRPKFGRESHVAGFGISFSKRGRGTGATQAIMREVFAFGKRHGVKIIFASCIEDNSRARKFYWKNGFREIALMKGHFRRGRKFVGTVLIEKLL